MNEYIKPPLGACPHWCTTYNRIAELSEAITRYSKHSGEQCNKKDGIACYKLIAQWAEEIKMLSEMEVKLCAMDIEVNQ